MIGFINIVTIIKVKGVIDHWIQNIFYLRTLRF
nr:MAG TPA: hypothetical protein [Caudoviricetes sp.]